MTTLEKFEAWVPRAVPESTQARKLFQGSDTEHLVPMDLLPTELQRFYSIVRGHCLLPHYGSTQDNLLLPSSAKEMSSKILDGEPVYLLSEHVDSWQVSIIHDSAQGWRVFRTGASHTPDWKRIDYPIVDLLVCYVLSEVTFGSNLTMSKTHRLADQLGSPERYGGMWFEDAIEALKKSDSIPARLFSFAKQDLFPIFSRSGDRIPTEFWYDSDTSFLWGGESFEDTGAAVKLPLRSALLDESKAIAEQGAAEHPATAGESI